MRGRLGGALVVALIVFAVVGAVAPSRAGAAGEAYFSVDLKGTGTGTVQSLTSQNGTPDNQIDCRMFDGFIDPREVCGNQFFPAVSGTRIWYRIQPAANSCVDVGGTCSPGYTTYYDLFPGQDVTASITINYHYVKLMVGVADYAFGNSKVTSADGFINCLPTCNHNYLAGTAVKLTAVPDTSRHLDYWGGACSGSGPTCDLVMTSDTEVTAVFALGAVQTPGPTPTATALTTPAASTRASAGATAHPSATPKASGPAGSSPAAGASGLPSTSTAPATDGASLDPSAPGGTLGPPSPADSAPASAGGAQASAGSIDPAGAGGGTDVTPIVLSILGAGLFIAIAIGFVGYRMGRRGPGAATRS